MKISLELLFHYRCDSCDRWWSIADVPPREKWTQCPHCPVCPNIEGVEYQPAKGLSAEALQKLGAILKQVSKQLEEAGAQDANVRN